MSVCPYGVLWWQWRHGGGMVSSRPTSNFYHVQSSRSPVRPLLSKVKPSCIYSNLKPHGQSSISPYKLLLSEAKPSCIYTILKPHSQRSRSDQLGHYCARQRLIFKPHGQSFRGPVRPLLSEGKPSYAYSILKPHGQSSITSPESVQSSCVRQHT